MNTDLYVIFVFCNICTVTDWEKTHHKYLLPARLCTSNIQACCLPLQSDTLVLCCLLPDLFVCAIMQCYCALKKMHTGLVQLVNVCRKHAVCLTHQTNRVDTLIIIMQICR